MSDPLPQGWASAHIAELCDVPKEKGEENVVPYLEIGNVDIASKSYTLTDKPSVKGCRVAKKNDILVSKVRPTRGAIIWIREQELQVSSAFTVLRNKGALAEKCLWHFLAWNRGYLNHLGESCTGTMYPTTSDEAVINFEVPLAPLPEQRRIVAKLETLLGKVDTCQQRLAKIPVLLKRFRQSVLATACSGRLTVDWRDDQPAASPQSIRSSLTEEIATPDLPETWLVAALNDCCNRIIDGNYGADYPKKDEFITSGIPFLTSSAIGEDGNIIETEIRFIAPSKHAILKKAQTTLGDVVFTNRGARVGATAMLLDSRFTVSNIGPQVTRLASNPVVLLPKYLFLWMRTSFFTSTMKERNGGSAMNFLNLTVTKALPIFLPPLPEQQEIVRRVEGLFALADQIAARFEKAHAQVEKLMPTILARAFRGELVAQDPNDEPASMLLERIKKTAKNGEPKRRGRRAALASV